MIHSYDTLPIGKYLEICKLYESKGINEDDRTIAVLSILNDIAEDDLLNMPIPDFMKMKDRAAFLFAEPIKDKKKVASVYNLGPFTLIPTTDIYRMTAAQYIDYQTFSPKGADFLAQTLSCFLVPKGKKYAQDYDIAQVQDAIRKYLPVTAAFALSAFFLRKLLRSIRITLISSEWRLKAMIKHPKAKRTLAKVRAARRSLENGDGFTTLTRLPKLPGSLGMMSGK